MTLFLQYLFFLAVAAFIAWRFYWYGREDGVKVGLRYSETRYQSGKRDGYTEGYVQGQSASYDAGYKDGWAYRNKKMGGGS